jgi:membrane-bound ClpP family serine protease
VTLILIILLLLIGMALVFAEILVIPGTSIAGFVGFLFYFIGILFTYDHYGKSTGHWVLLGTFTASLVFIFLALRSGFWNKFQLENKLEGSINDLDIGDIEIGDRGEALSALRPSGNALFHNEIFEVQTQGEFLDAHTEIEVTLIEDNRIIVKRSS